MVINHIQVLRWSSMYLLSQSDVLTPPKDQEIKILTKIPKSSKVSHWLSKRNPGCPDPIQVVLKPSLPQNAASLVVPCGDFCNGGNRLTPSKPTISANGWNVGLRPGSLGSSPLSNPFHKGNQSESKPPGPKPTINTIVLKTRELPFFLALCWNWLVVSTHLKNISKTGSFPQIGMKIKNLSNHHLV